jgi:hypothetical protein
LICDRHTYHRDTPTNGVLPYNVANTYSTVLLGLDFKFGGGSVVAKDWSLSCCAQKQLYRCVRQDGAAHDRRRPGGSQSAICRCQ